MSKEIAILCSDLHLSLQAPACRADKDWLTVQADYLHQLKRRAGGNDLKPALPVICAGDIFDRWNAPPELIRFALCHLPNGMICVAGQHDLPNHSHSEMHRSAYGVLVEAEKIRDISFSKEPWIAEHFIAYGFGWNQKIELNEPLSREGSVNLAVIHRYVSFDAATAYVGADESTRLNRMPELKSFDAVLLGDNHIPWCWRRCFFNHGTFIRRKSDEIHLEPAMGILHSDGTITRELYDTSKDRFHENAKERETVSDTMRQFIEGLEGLGEHGLNFRTAVKHHLESNKLPDETKRIILESLEEKS
jgi:hypothetical protein